MDYQGLGSIADGSIDALRAQRSGGVVVYDADGERLGTVSDWQDVHRFLLVHQGQPFGQDTYIPHAAIRYSDMNGVHLRLRHIDLMRMPQPLLEQDTPQSLFLPRALPILALDVGIGAVAATAFAVGAASAPAPVSGASTHLAIETAQDITMQMSSLAEHGKSRRLWRRSKG